MKYKKYHAFVHKYLNKVLFFENVSGSDCHGQLHALLYDFIIWNTGKNVHSSKHLQNLVLSGNISIKDLALQMQGGRLVVMTETLLCKMNQKDGGKVEDGCGTDVTFVGT